jgi:hypothetical protein
MVPNSGNLETSHKWISLSVKYSILDIPEKCTTYASHNND